MSNTLLKLFKNFRRSAALLSLAGLVVVAGAASVAADTKQSVPLAYGVEGALQQGMIVRLSDKDSTKVSAVENSRSKEVQGIVISANDAALSLASDAAERQVYVATYGRYDVLVSDQSGPVKAGSYITVSSLDGIGMRAGNTESVVVGKAVSGFNGTSNVVSSATLKNKQGKPVPVSIGRVTVDIGIMHNPLFKDDNQSTGVVGFLKNASSSVAGKSVSPARVYLGVVILLLSAAISGSVLYSGVRSSITAIGRNPLARQSIIRSLFQVVSVSLIVLVIGLTGVYLLLKL